jgi:NADH:ubiquinone oxidoreductase subunit 6 (subunit J)
MLELFEKLARRIEPFRMLIVLMFIAVCVAAAWVLLMASAELQDRWLIPTILALVWVLLLYSGLLLFAQVPAAKTNATRWRDRLSVKIKRGGYHLFAWFMLLVSAAVVIVTFQLSMAWIRML